MKGQLNFWVDHEPTCINFSKLFDLPSHLRGYRWKHAEPKEAEGNLRVPDNFKKILEKVVLQFD